MIQANLFDLHTLTVRLSVLMRRSVPAFEHVLLVRISQLLITQLQNLLDPACEPGAQASVLRIVLRVSRTVLQQFHPQLGPKNGVLLEALLSGQPAWSVLRQGCHRWSCCLAPAATQVGATEAAGTRCVWPL